MDIATIRGSLLTWLFDFCVLEAHLCTALVGDLSVAANRHL